MSQGMSPDSEQFIHDVVASGFFQYSGEALDAAAALLKRRIDLRRHLDEGTRQLRTAIDAQQTD